MTEKEEILKHGLEVIEKKSIVNRMLIAVNLIGKGNRVLELGCRSGEVTKLYCNDNDVVGIDFIPEFIAKAKELKGEFLIYNLEGTILPFENDTFDIVYCGEIIEHIRNRLLFMSEVRRVLKHSGRLILTTSNKLSTRRRLKLFFGRPIHDMNFYVDWLTHKELERLINFSNFKIITWINDKTRVKNVTLPFTNKSLCDNWIIEARKTCQTV